MPTFDEMVAKVRDDLNLTSDDSVERVGQRVNSRYRKVLSAIGLETSQRGVLSLPIDPVDSDFDDLPELVVEGLEKILRIQLYLGATQHPRLLDELTYDEVTALTPRTSTPYAWAPKRMGAGQVTIVLDGYPATDTFTLLVEGYETTTELEDDAEPNFSTDYHDILVEGAKADERRKMEKYDMAAEHEKNFEQILSDLKMYIAKSAYKDIYQGKTSPAWSGRVYERYRRV